MNSDPSVRADSTPDPHLRWDERPMQLVYCRNCGRGLFKVTPGGLRAGVVLEIKCKATNCKTLNYLMGPQR